MDTVESASSDPELLKLIGSGESRIASLIELGGDDRRSDDYR